MTERTKEAMLEKMLELNQENSLNKEGKAVAVTLFKNAQKVGNKIFLEIPLNMMRIDRKMYQRPPQNHARTIAREWNEDRCDPLKVNYRNDGYFYVIDGQHRREAGIMRCLDTLTCIVYVGLTVKEEADIFVETNTNSSRPDPYDTYKANICRGEATDMAIHEVCTHFGVKVERHKGTKTLKSVSTAREVIRRHGKETLFWIFNLIENSEWHLYTDAYTSDIMASLCNVKIQYEKNLDEAEKALLAFFKNSNPKEITALANATYPQCYRRERFMKLLVDIIKEGKGNSKVTRPMFGVARAL